MSETRPPFGQPDIIRLSDEDASLKLLEGAVGGLGEVLNGLTQSGRPRTVVRTMHLFETGTVEEFLELGKIAGITEVEPARRGWSREATSSRKC
jgi:hypothetical protein